MTVIEEYALRAREIRERLRHPPNAVPDQGIDLKRKPVPTVRRILTYPPIPTPPEPEKFISLNAIINATADYFLIGVRDILGHSRRPAVCYPRHIAIYLACKHLLCRHCNPMILCKHDNPSITKLSKLFRKDHTSLIHGRDKIRMESGDELVKRQIAAIEEMLGAYD